MKFIEIDGATLTADVCVIGTGAGGAVVAARLAEAGYEVVVLEEGGNWAPSDFTEDEGEMVPRLYADRGARATDDLAISLLQGRCVGGGTTVMYSGSDDSESPQNSMPVMLGTMTLTL